VTGGILVLCSEAVFIALTFEALNNVSNVLLWQRFSFLSIALLPGPWLLFSLIFARGGDHSVISTRSAIMLACACVLPAAVALMAWDQLLMSTTDQSSGDGVSLRLG